MKVLIVDDEEMIREVLKRYVEFEGNESMEAEDGMEAVRLCREYDFDVVLMDVMMPRLDGYSAVKEIRKTKDTPIIMLSARGEECRIRKLHPLHLALGLGVPPAGDACIDPLRSRRLDVPHPLVRLFGERRAGDSRYRQQGHSCQ